MLIRVSIAWLNEDSASFLLPFVLAPTYHRSSESKRVRLQRATTNSRNKVHDQLVVELKTWRNKKSKPVSIDDVVYKGTGLDNRLHVDLSEESDLPYRLTAQLIYEC